MLLLGVILTLGGEASAEEPIDATAALYVGRQAVAEGRCLADRGRRVEQLAASLERTEGPARRSRLRGELRGALEALGQCRVSAPPTQKMPSEPRPQLPIPTPPDRPPRVALRLEGVSVSPSRLDRFDVEQAVLQALASLTRCYVPGAERPEKLLYHRARARLRFRADGTVAGAQLEGGFGTEEADVCVRARLQTLRISRGAAAGGGRAELELRLQADR